MDRNLQDFNLASNNIFISNLCSIFFWKFKSLTKTWKFLINQIFVPLLIQFLHWMHLQLSPQTFPAAKHSQYFFEHWVLLQLQVTCLDFFVIFFYFGPSSIFLHDKHTHFSPQPFPFLKQKQYYLRQFDFLHWQERF